METTTDFEITETWKLFKLFIYVPTNLSLNKYMHFISYPQNNYMINFTDVSLFLSTSHFFQSQRKILMFVLSIFK